MNSCADFHRNPSSTRWDILVLTEVLDWQTDRLTGRPYSHGTRVTKNKQQTASEPVGEVLSCWTFVSSGSAAPVLKFVAELCGFKVTHVVIKTGFLPLLNHSQTVCLMLKHIPLYCPCSWRLDMNIWSDSISGPLNYTTSLMWSC